MTVSLSQSAPARFAAIALALLLVGGCAAAPTVRDASPYLPRAASTPEVVQATSEEELRRLQLVATNLVAAMLQSPELQPSAETLQVNAPTSAFGNVLLRALENAGYGLQLVPTDQGRNYVRYRQSQTETERGPIEDYAVAVGAIEFARDYITRDGRIYPLSLMEISGTELDANADLADDLFREQGGRADEFLSGTRPADGFSTGETVQTVEVAEYDAIPIEQRTSQMEAFEQARRRFFETRTARAAPDLTRYERFRRTVLIFDDTTTQILGPSGKKAIRLMMREAAPEDRFVIKSCHDADGQNDDAFMQAFRVEEELVAHGASFDSVWSAPCSRSSYRHASDTVTAPVELLLYRPLQPAASAQE